jgi:hypothetical protein
MGADASRRIIPVTGAASRWSRCGDVGAGPFVPVGATPRTETPAIGATEGHHGPSKERGFAHSGIELHTTAIVEDEFIVRPQVVLLAPPAADSIGVQVDHEVEGKAEALEAAGTFLFALGGDAGRDVELIADPIDVDRDGKHGRPRRSRQLERFRSGNPLFPVEVGLKGRQFKA